MAWAVAVCTMQAGAAWGAHAYSQFGDIKYPSGFSHFGHVNPKAPKGGDFSLVAPLIANSFDKFNPFTTRGNAPAGVAIWMIEGLAQKSLLTVERGGTSGRYRMLNTTRCHAREQLERSGEGIELERRHMRYINRTRQASDVHVLA